MFWICEVLRGHVLTGHAEHCPYLIRRRKRDAESVLGPFQSRKLAAAAAKQPSATFRWCKWCSESRDSSNFAELNFQLDQARVEYNAALSGTSKAAVDAANDKLDKVLHAFRLFLRNNRRGRSAKAASG
jgi:hypothetical protein